MKISTKGTYGLKAVIDLAMNLDKENVTIKNIAERQNISEGYLEQIFSILRKNGIVKGRKGQGGGYTLCKNLDEITVGELLRVLEGDLFVVDFQEDGNKIEKCLKKNIWDKIDESINNVVDGITVQDLIEEYKKGEEGYMFYI